MTVLPRDFFAQPTLTVARKLLGQRLVRLLDGQRLSGRIVETEAYIGPDDTASHASKGRTARTEVMFGPPGRTYVYLIYGMHYMLNLVTEPAPFPAAVLIRALEPLEGLERIRQNRAGLKDPRQLTNGPGKLCQALKIDRSLHDWDVTRQQLLWIEAAAPALDLTIAAGPRIGIDYAHPKDRQASWRFWLAGNPFVSK